MTGHRAGNAILHAAAVVGAVAIGLLAPSAALAASSWSGPAGIDANALNSVSCPSASFCAAVDGAGGALTYNGSTWSTPAAVDTTSLVAVSCPSASFCAAVDGAGGALTYNGSTWSTPVHIDTQTNTLTSVSCPSASFCVAVDDLGEAFTYNGSTWSTTAAVVDHNALTAVSCPSASFCAAVDDAGGATTYNGSTWNTTYGIDANTALRAVSCPSASFCAAVDDAGNALTYNGSAWSAPAAVDNTRLTSVSCPSASFCAAVDFRGNALTYDGTWSSPAAVDSSSPPLMSVSCPSSSFCVAVDFGGNAYKYSQLVRACGTSQLRLSLVRILGAAGHRSWDLALRNAGGAACTLRGYPTVRLLDRRGRPLRVAVARRRSRVVTVTLAPGQRAFFTLTYVDGGPCIPHFFIAYGLSVTPPRNGRWLLLQRHSTVCSASLGGHPTITPIRAKLDGI
ncbi:MAG: DUF4232 domain-containing protein [Actinomycetota bacterium]|nr:DUF4232 domain-containing protein [Actinomycetota bacterium]